VAADAKRRFQTSVREMLVSSSDMIIGDASFGTLGCCESTRFSTLACSDRSFSP
jgi:hypothetical protein